MCGRFVIAADGRALQEAFGLKETPDVAPRFNVAPTQLAPVITSEHPDVVSMFRWGLVPSWSKDISVGSKMINARAEGIEDKPSFRTALRRKRCLVPATGLYEWRADPGGKTPMYIHLLDQPVFALAGLWEVWRDAEGRDLRTFTIITTAANAFMESLHTRMPVILHREDHARWLDTSDVPLPALLDLLRGYEPDRMRAYEVSRAVNRPAVDDKSLIEPIAS
jgi:putative SOS response-associated peptidase YedK